MATNCEDVSARMMELLYGELPDGERTTLETHLAGCARCRGELDGFQKARALARTALDEPAPSRARAAILSAAAAHAAAARPARRPERGDGTERTSFWAWLRTRWTLPTLATVGAVAVFLIGSRLFLDPARTYERGQHPLLPTPAEEKAPVVVPLPAEGEAPPPPVGAFEPGSNAAGPSGAAPASRSARPVDLIREKNQAKPASAAKDDRLDDLLLSGAKHKGKAESPSVAVDLGGLGSLGPGRGGGAAAERDRFAQPPPPKAKVAEAPQKPASAKETSEGGTFAPAPPPKPSRAAPAPARRAAAADSFGQEEEAKPLDGELAKSLSSSDKQAPAEPRAEPNRAPAPATRPAPAAPAPAAATAHAAKKKSSVDSFSDAAGAPTAAAPPPAPAAETKSSAGRGKGSGAAETLVQRADRLFTEGRWAEAAAAYRELLRNDPRSADADRWRRRLAVAAQAEGDAGARRAAPAAADRQQR